MKILVASDIHGSKTAIEKIQKILTNIDAKLLILCGDFLNHGPRNALPDGYDTKATASILNGLKDKIVCVRGNCDSEVDQMVLEFPVTQSTTQLIFANEQNENSKLNGRVFVTHGHLYTTEQLESLLPKGTLIIQGHTHVPVLEFKDGYCFLNPGSISIPKTDEGATYAVLEVEENQIKKIVLYSLDEKELHSLTI